MKKNAALFFLLLLCPSAFSQTNYYVDGANGSDSNNGTSLGTAWETIQKACDAAVPNSIVQIKAGTYHENINVNVSGTAGNPIIFRNYGNDVVFIDGTGTSSPTLLTVSNKSYLTFRNLIFQNLTISDAQGILVEATGSNTATSLTFKNIEISNINWTNNPSAIPNSNNNAQAFIVYGGNGGITNLTIDSCHVHDNILGYSEALSLDGNINGFTVANCRVHDNTNIGIDVLGNYGVSSNPATDHARNGIISKNKCYRNVSLAATSAGIYIDGAWKLVVEKNICYENGYGIEIGCEENGTTDSMLVKNNIFYNNKATGISMGGYTTSTTGQVLHSIIRNNIFFHNDSDNSGNGELVMTKASYCSFENNIFYTNSQNTLLYVDAISPQSNNNFNYNCWYTPANDPNNITVNWGSSGYSTFAGYKAGTSQEANSIYSNPDLTTPLLPSPDLHILGTSSCIDAGNSATVVSSGETDYDGNARLSGTAIDMGAFEFVDISNGVKNIGITKLSNVLVFPNPFTKETTIYTEHELKDAELVVYNILGNKQRHIKSIYSRQIVLERSGLAKGIYFFDIIESKARAGRGKIVVE